MSYIYTAERTIDCDGKGWAFRRFDIDPSVVETFERILRNWEHVSALAYNRLIDMVNVPASERSRAVAIFTRAVHKQPEVFSAWQQYARALEWIDAAVKAIDDRFTVDECDVIGEEDFRARYRPLIVAADDANDNHWHEDYFARTGYTSIFNGR